MLPTKADKVALESVADSVADSDCRFKIADSPTGSRKPVAMEQDYIRDIERIREEEYPLLRSIQQDF